MILNKTQAVVLQKAKTRKKIKIGYWCFFELIGQSDEAERTAQKMKFSIKNFFSKCDQICRKLRVWSHLLKKSLTENFIFLHW